MTSTTPSASPLIDYVEKLIRTDDRGGLAALRRGLGKEPGEAPEMFPHVVPRLRPDLSTWQERVHYLIASLAAWHPLVLSPDDRPRGFGRTLADVVHHRDRGSHAIDQRMTALLGAHRHDVSVHVRRLVGLCRSAGVPVDWHTLLDDLVRWDDPWRRTQRSWAKQYWTPSTPAAVDTVGASDNT